MTHHRQINRTLNYMWLLRDLLGTGASGNVYKGSNKNTGEIVAVKVPKTNIKPTELQERELDVLKRFKHPNIVQLITVEHCNQRDVIIMEYCNGGSLQNMLMEPQNVFGFDEQEFLTVLHDIASGMKKLRNEKVVHRDIKPGNIMRCIGLDGKTVYKLIDFDAARELKDEENFESLYGTEEYLHPQMYDRCFMNNAKTSFTHHVDLWSIGATLYHVATGQLPFQPYEKRKNKMIMSKMLGGRSLNAISGMQLKLGGPITYSKHLPKNIVMSQGLRPHIEKLIVLLFANESSFDQFFDAEKEIDLLRRVTTFHYATTELLHIYLPPSTTFEQFQDKVKEVTGLEALMQLLIYQNLPFSSQFSTQTGHLVVKETTTNDPVYLFSHQQHLLQDTGFDNRIFNFPDVTSYKNLDDNLWQPCQESLHYILRAVTNVVNRQFAITSGSKMFIQYITRKFDRLDSFKSHVVDILQSHFSKLNSVQLLVGLVYSMDQSKASLSGLEEYNKHLRSAQKIEIRLAKVSSQSKTTSDQLSSLVDFWLLDKPGCRQEDCCISRINAWIREVDMWKKDMMEMDKLELEDEKLIKGKLGRALKTAKELVEGHCQPNSRGLYEEFKNFMISAWSIYEDLAKCEDELTRMMEVLKTLDEEEKTADDNRKINLEIPSTLPSSNTTITPTLPFKSNPMGSKMEVQRESRESEFMRKLMSVSCERKSLLLKEMLPLAQENHRLTQNISQTLMDWMSHVKVDKE